MIAIGAVLRDTKIKFLITEMMSRSNAVRYIHKKVQRYAEKFDLPATKLPYDAFEMEFHKHYTYHNEPTAFMFTLGEAKNPNREKKKDIINDVLDIDRPDEAT